MSTWNWVQVAAAVVVALIAAAGRKLPAWLGFVFMIAVSILIVIVGIAESATKFIPFGIAAALSSGVAWISAATSEAQANDDTLGGASDNIPAWGWIVIAVLMVTGVVLAVVLH